MELDIFNKFSTDFSALKTVAELKEKQEAFFLDLTYIVNKSIVEGEYIIITETAEGLTSFFEMLSFDLQEFTHIKGAKFIEIEDFKNSIKYLISLYSLFSKKICKLYKREVIEYIDIDVFIETDNPFYKKFYTFFQLTQNNIELSKIDHQFINDESLLKELFRVKNNIKNLRIQVSDFKDNIDRHNLFTIVRDALLLKVNFLIDKWYVRSSTKLKNSESQFVEFVNTNKNNNLNNYKDTIKYLYELNNYNHSSILEDKFNLIDKSNLEKLFFSELHTLIKYYKDKVKNLDKLKEVLDTFSKKKDHTYNNLFESFSLQISYQYCLNNYFSLFCENFYKDCTDLNETNITEKLYLLHSKFKEVKANSISITDNFFIQYKFLTYSFLIIEKAIKNAGENTIEVLNNSSDYFNITLKVALEEYENKTQWSLKNNNYIFKLPYKESLITYKNLNIYFASSFLLPKVNDDIINEKRILLNNYHKLTTLFNIENQIVELQTLKYNFNKEIKTLNENFDTTNKKLLETVTIFTAIISFIVGSIGAYKFLTTFTEALIFIIVFGISISIFVLLIFISTKGIEALKKYKLSLIGIYSLALIILIVLIPFNYHSREYIENSNKSRDSLHNDQERKIENLEKLILLKKSSQN